jgi:glutathione S-transferase
VASGGASPYTSHAGKCRQEDFMLKLYHGRTSVCSVKTRLAFAEKGVNFDSHLMTLQGDQFDPAYMKLNPNAVVPTLVHDDKVIIESTVIMHYIDDLFPDPPLMPRDPFARSKVHMTTKLMDEYVHNCCTVLTFATANRQSLLKKSAEQLETELAKSPSKARAEVKRQVYHFGLDAPVVIDALRHHQKLLNRIDAAMKEGPYIAGAAYSLADIAATPYIWRLTKLRLSRLWDDRPGVARWYERIQQRPTFAKAVEGWLTKAEHDRYDKFEPDPWPKVRLLLQTA